MMLQKQIIISHLASHLMLVFTPLLWQTERRKRTEEMLDKPAAILKKLIQISSNLYSKVANFSLFDMFVARTR